MNISCYCWYCRIYGLRYWWNMLILGDWGYWLRLIGSLLGCVWGGWEIVGVVRSCWRLFGIDMGSFCGMIVRSNELVLNNWPTVWYYLFFRFIIYTYPQIQKIITHSSIKHDPKTSKSIPTPINKLPKITKPAPDIKLIQTNHPQITNKNNLPLTHKHQRCNAKI